MVPVDKKRQFRSDGIPPAGGRPPVDLRHLPQPHLRLRPPQPAQLRVPDLRQEGIVPLHSHPGPVQLFPKTEQQIHPPSRFPPHSMLRSMSQQPMSSTFNDRPLSLFHGSEALNKISNPVPLGSTPREQWSPLPSPWLRGDFASSLLGSSSIVGTPLNFKVSPTPPPPSSSRFRAHRVSPSRPKRRVPAVAAVPVAVGWRLPVPAEAPSVLRVWKVPARPESPR